jgi:aconitate hydratase 2/2-methylisocitrate dehydratase
VLKTQFLYEADTARLEAAFEWYKIATILESYAKAEFFTQSEVEEIKVVTYVAGEGDISTDLLSPETKHTLDQIVKHGKCLTSSTS